MERVNIFSCIGVCLDPRLTWVEHVEDKCKQVLNTMRCLSGLEWGGGLSITENISLIRSRIDYGSVVYDSAAKSVFTRLDY